MDMPSKQQELTLNHTFWLFQLHRFMSDSHNIAILFYYYFSKFSFCSFSMQSSVETHLFEKRQRPKHLLQI